MTFTGTLEDGVIRWDGDAPPGGVVLWVTASPAAAADLAAWRDRPPPPHHPADRDRPPLVEFPLVTPPGVDPSVSAVDVLRMISGLPADQRTSLEQWQQDRDRG